MPQPRHELVDVMKCKMSICIAIRRKGLTSAQYVNTPRT